MNFDRRDIYTVTGPSGCPANIVKTLNESYFVVNTSIVHMHCVVMYVVDIRSK